MFLYCLPIAARNKVTFGPQVRGAVYAGHEDHPPLVPPQHDIGKCGQVQQPSLWFMCTVDSDTTRVAFYLPLDQVLQ